MSLSFILLVVALAALIGFLYVRAEKRRGKSGSVSDGSDMSFSLDSGSHCNDSDSGCGGDGGGGD